MKGYSTTLAARNAADKNRNDRKIWRRHAALQVANSFSIPQPCLNALMPPIRPVYGNDTRETFLFSGARTTPDGHPVYTRCAVVSRSRRSVTPYATSWPKLSRTNDSLNFIALTFPRHAFFF